MKNALRGPKYQRAVPASAGIVVAALLCLAAPTHALTPKMQTVKDISIGVGEHLPTGWAGGIGARSLSMGGTASAVNIDGTALFTNPSQLTGVRRTEILASLTTNRVGSTVDLGSPSFRESASATGTALNTLVISAPYPVYRGGFTFSLGYARRADYRVRTGRSGIVSLQGQSFRQSETLRQEGGLSDYSMGFGVEVSPTTSFGLGLRWQQGSVDVRRDVTLVAQAAAPADSLVGRYRQRNSIDGLGMLFGTHTVLPAGFQLGLSICTPTKYSLDGTWGDEYHEAIGASVYHFDYLENKLKYKVKSPWEFGAGLAWTTYALTVATDVWYTDWQQARFEGNPYGAGSAIDADTFFENRYRGSLRWHVGAEVLVPRVNTYLRAGYWRSADPFRGPLLDTGEPLTVAGPTRAYSMGAGWLIDRVLSLDVAGVWRAGRTNTAQAAEKSTDRRFALSAGFRM